MDKPLQKIVWTILPNGVTENSLQLSIFVAPQLINPAGVPTLPLKTGYPDFRDWRDTIENRIRFAIRFEGGPTFIEQGWRCDSGTPAQASILPRLQRLTPSRLKYIKNPWQEVFATAEGSTITPVVKSFNQQNPADNGIIAFSTRKVLNAVSNQYAALLGATASSTDLDNRASGAGVTPNISPKPGLPMTGNQLNVYQQNLKQKYQGLMRVTTTGEQEILAEINQRIDDLSLERPVPPLSVPPPTFGDEEWNITLAFFYHLLLGQTPSRRRSESQRTFSNNAAEAADDNHALRIAATSEIEFHTMVASVASYPMLLRHLGLVLDFEIPLSSFVSQPVQSGLVKAVPCWVADPSVEKQDSSPWTSYIFSSNRLFQPKPLDDSDLFNGLLDLSARTNGIKRFHLEQIDALGEALKLTGYVLAVQNESSMPSDVFTTLRGGGIALTREGFEEQLRVQMKTLEIKVNAIHAHAGDDITLTAENLVRGYRMDIERNGVWLSLSERLGEYFFIAKNKVEKFLPDEGWITTCGATVGDGATTKTRLAVQDIICKWEGWSIASPRPGTGMKSDSIKNKALDNPDSVSTFKAKFAVKPRSLPSLRFNESYRVRVRLTDLAGNSISPEDPIASDPRLISEPIVYRRFDPILPPDVIPRATPDVEHGENVYTLVIRSNYNTRCKEITARHIAPPKCSELLAETHGFLDEPENRVDEDKYETIVEYDADAPLIAPEKEYKVPYLSDPLAVGAYLHYVPGTTSEIYPIDFSRGRKKWPKVKTWRIRVIEDPGTVLSDDELPVKFRPPDRKDEDDAGELTIYLPKAEDLTIPINSILTKNDLDVMAIWHFILTTFPYNSALFEQHILNGCHWMFTPCKGLRLVHAVQQPLFKPSFKDDSPQQSLPPEKCIIVSKKNGDTFATLNATMRMPGRSARSYTIKGDWIEMLDDGPSFRKGPGSSTAFSNDLENENRTMEISGRHEFNDTKHREITYTVIATTRFREYLKITDDDIASGRAPITRESRKVTVQVPNSAVPAVPDVAYVIPTFGWEQQQRETALVSHIRNPGGLRVYLNRPWFTTGSNELLGVLLPDPYAGAPAPLETHISRWGRDPLSKLRGPARPLSVTDLKGRIQHQRSFDWSEAQGRVVVLGYPVEYDSQRNLWFADIEIDPETSYFPFVRLALTRYQPFSVEPTSQNPQNLFLSPVVLSDFCQLTPERKASVVIDTVGPGHLLKIRLDGKAQVRENEVTVTVERGREDFNGEIRWEQATEPQPMRFENDIAAPFWSIEELSIPFGTGPLRIVFKEYERQIEDKPDDPRANPQETKRIVYADAIYL